MEVYVLLCFFAIVTMCQADTSSFEPNTDLRNSNNLPDFVARSNTEMADYRRELHDLSQSKGYFRDFPVNNFAGDTRKNIPDDFPKVARDGAVEFQFSDFDNSRRYYAPAPYGYGGGYAGANAGASANAGARAGIGAGISAGLSAGISAGLSAGIGAGAGAAASAGANAYGYGGGHAGGYGGGYGYAAPPPPYYGK